LPKTLNLIDPKCLNWKYAQVIKMLGNGRLEAMCFDGVKRLCHIRGKLRKKVWINTSDIVLIGLRDYQDTKADVILKYNADEARSLKAYGELPEHAKINETDTFGPGDDDEIQFDDIGSDEEDIDDVSVYSDYDFFFFFFSFFFFYKLQISKCWNLSFYCLHSYFYSTIILIYINI
uniref:Eukaryotic translation initiation factor 4C n=1 Tax=Cyprinus carpio TaxID=7962 RepID=A0A8C2GIG7_CYPCA